MAELDPRAAAVFASAFADPVHADFTLPAAGPSALLIHGFPGTPAEMRGLGDVLHEAGWHVRGPLLPGFGSDTARLGQMRLEHWRDAVAAEVRALRQRGQPVLIAGHSLGGALALCAAADAPPDAMLLLAPFWKIDHPLWATLPALRFIVPSIAPFRLMKIEPGSPEAQAGIREMMPEADLNDPAVLRALRDFRIPTRLIAELHRAGAQAGTAARRVSWPTLVLQGANDRLVAPALTRQLAQRMPAQPRLIEVQGEHDLAAMRQPARPEIARHVLEFARGLS